MILLVLRKIICYYYFNGKKSKYTILYDDNITKWFKDKFDIILKEKFILKVLKYMQNII
jgi:hypothetical protein